MSEVSFTLPEPGDPDDSMAALYIAENARRPACGCIGYIGCDHLGVGCDRPPVEGWGVHLCADCQPRRAEANARLFAASSYLPSENWPQREKRFLDAALRPEVPR